MIALTHDLPTQAAAVWFALPVAVSTIWQLVADQPPEDLPWATALIAWVTMLVMFVWFGRQGEIDEVKVFRASFAVAFTALALLPPVLLYPLPMPLHVSLSLAFIGAAQVLAAWLGGSLRRFDFSAPFTGILAMCVGSLTLYKIPDEAFLVIVLLFTYGFGMMWGLSCWRHHLSSPAPDAGQTDVENV